MKDDINKLINLLPENLNEASKSSVIEVIRNGIDEAQKNWENKVTEKDRAIAEAESSIEDLKGQVKASEEKFTKLAEELENLKAQAEAKAKEDAYQARMASIDAEFVLSEEETEKVAKKALSLSEEQFTEWFEEFSIFAAAKRRSVIEASEKEKSEEIELLKSELSELKASKAKEESKASVEKDPSLEPAAVEITEEVLDDVVEEANQSIANAQVPEEEGNKLLKSFEAFKSSVKVHY